MQGRALFQGEKAAISGAQGRNHTGNRGIVEGGDAEKGVGLFRDEMRTGGSIVPAIEAEVFGLETEIRG